MSGVCGLSVLETHRISRATRTANVMSLFVFCESRGGRRTTLSPIIYLWSQPSASPVDLSVGRRPSALLAAELSPLAPPTFLARTGPAEARSRSPAPTPSQGYRSDEAAPLVLSRTLSARYADFRLFTLPGPPYLHTFTVGTLEKNPKSQTG